MRKNPKEKSKTRGPVVDLNGWELRCIDLVALKGLYVFSSAMDRDVTILNFVVSFKDIFTNTTNCALAFPLVGPLPGLCLPESLPGDLQSSGRTVNRGS